MCNLAVVLMSVCCCAYVSPRCSLDMQADKDGCNCKADVSARMDSSGCQDYHQSKCWGWQHTHTLTHTRSVLTTRWWSLSPYQDASSLTELCFLFPILLPSPELNPAVITVLSNMHTGTILTHILAFTPKRRARRLNQGAVPKSKRMLVFFYNLCKNKTSRLII